MREIIFRGQTRRNGKKVWMDGRKVPSNWVYGGVLQGTGSFSIIYGCNDVDDKHASNLEKHVVYTDTLGQYTGLTDKNGKKIFEGDIVVYSYGNKPHLVEWVDTSCGFEPFSDSNKNCGHCGGGLMPEFAKVIGNIHDNPELLKGGADNG